MWTGLRPLMCLFVHLFLLLALQKIVAPLWILSIESFTQKADNNMDIFVDTTKMSCRCPIVDRLWTVIQSHEGMLSSHAIEFLHCHPMQCMTRERQKKAFNCFSFDTWIKLIFYRAQSHAVKEILSTCCFS